MHKNKMSRVMIYKAALLVILAAGTGCFTKSPEGIVSPASISPDDSLICYVNAKGGTNSIYIVNRTGAKVGEINVSDGQVPFDPIFSPDGKKILYLSENQKAEKPQSAVYWVDVDGQNSKCLIPEKDNITEAVFSPDGKTLYFLSAGFYGHYSPIVGSRPHDFDLYSTDVTGGNPKQWTHLKAYGMHDLEVSGDGKSLFFIEDAEKNNLLALSLNGEGEPVTIISDIWDSQVAPDVKSLTFTQIKQGVGGFKYDLYFRNLQSSANTEVKQLTFLNSMVFGIRYFHQRPYVLFLQQTNWPNTSSREYQLKEMNLDGSDLKQIILPK